MLMRKGIDKLINDKFYRNMYDNYKETQGCYRGSGGLADMYTEKIDMKGKKPYQNELARILNEDCEMEKSDPISKLKNAKK